MKSHIIRKNAKVVISKTEQDTQVKAPYKSYFGLHDTLLKIFTFTSCNKSIFKKMSLQRHY